jgi:DNA-binding SARP family transcriptional activator
MSDDPHCAQIALEVLGPLRVCDERRTIKIAGAKERTLLARLVASAGRLVTTDELIDCLWSDDPPRTAAKSLQTYVLRLRNLLEPNRHRSPQLLLTDGPGYRLAVSDDAIDARRFARLVDNGRRAFRAGDAAAATEKLRDSLRLWRGRAYAGFELNPVLGGESRRLEELRLVALEDRIAADLDVGRSRETVAELESLVHEHRLRERFWCLLMLALYRAGRQADALAAHARARELLVDELGVEPGEQLRTLHGQVLAQDHRLLVPASPSPPLAPPPEPKVCPWKGLAAYDVADAPWFAGRERLVAELLARIATARVVAVVGASGSGKSSLVRAGLLASLPDSTGWVRVLMRPGSHPLRELERVRGNSDGRRVVLVVDQLEELWTACANPVERKEFLDALADLVVPGNRTLVLAVRADYFAELADQPVLAGAVADATVLVGTPSEGEVRRAVQHPADRGGLELDIGLADALVADAGHGPGALPLLSTALTELWDQRDGQRLTLTAYVEAGGVHGAVARLAERAYDALDPGDQRAARILLLRLASVGDGETVTRRRVPLAELAALPDPRVRAVVEPLARARLLSLGAGHVEVVHEALFREWPRLQAWLQEDATGRATQRRLAIAAGEWHAGGREPTELWRGTRLAAGLDFAATHPDELTEVEHAFLAAGRAQQDTERIAAEHQAGVATRQNRRLRWLLGGLAVLLSVALTAGVVAVRSAARAEREALVASAHELAAASVANLAVDPERSILLALEAVAQARSLDGPVRWQAEEALHRAVITSRVVLSVPGLGGNLDWSPDGSVFVTEGPENAGVVDIRDATTGRSVRSWHGHDGDITDVAFSPDGTMLATTGDDGAARLWDPATGEGLTAIQGPRGEVSAPSFSPDGSLLAASWENDGVRVVEIDTGRTVRELGAFALQTAFSPEGDRLVIASGEPEATVADIGSGELSRLGNQSWGINEVAWSTSGAWIATAGTDLTAQIWDAETGELRFTLFGHTGFVNTVDWSSDSARLITGSADGTAKVWELTDGGPRVLLTLSAHDTRAGLRAVFSPVNPPKAWRAPL